MTPPPDLTVATFYKFVRISDLEALRQHLIALCRGHGITGSILLAREGINATISGTATAIEATLAILRTDPRFCDLAVKLSQATDPPFRRLKVRLKKEIVTLGRADADPTVRVGRYVDPHDWNDVIDDPGTLVLDTRNAYEVAIGTFRGAVNPATRAFGELPDFVERHLDLARHRTIAMFCTGGIRCEKASAYLLGQGFGEVLHLRGGILAYLAAVPSAESRWTGECYVFDGRVALGHGLSQGTHVMRRACGHPMPHPMPVPGANGGAADAQLCPMCAGETVRARTPTGCT